MGFARHFIFNRNFTDFNRRIRIFHHGGKRILYTLSGDFMISYDFQNKSIYDRSIYVYTDMPYNMAF